MKPTCRRISCVGGIAVLLASICMFWYEHLERAMRMRIIMRAMLVPAPAPAPANVKWGFYLHVFNQPKAVIRKIQQVRSMYAESPIYVVSDGGLDFSAACASVGKCHFSWRPPANDRINPKPFLARFRDAALWLHAEYVVMLEPDTKLNGPITHPPTADAGGVRDVWNPELSKGLCEYMTAMGKKRRPDFVLRWRHWGLTGGTYIRAAAALDAFDADLVDWETVELLEDGKVYDSDVAMPIALSIRGFEFEPWLDAGQEGRQTHVPAFEHAWSKPYYNQPLTEDETKLVAGPHPGYGNVTCRGCIWQLDEERGFDLMGGFWLNMTKAGGPGRTQLLGSAGRRSELCFFWPTYPPHFKVTSIRLELQSSLAEVNDGAGVPAQYVLFDNSDLLREFCRRYAAACALQGAHGFTLMSLMELADFQQLYGACASNAYRRDGRCSLAGWALWQSMKKLLGTSSLHARCSRVWLADSESFPFRRYSVAALAQPHAHQVLWPYADWSTRSQEGCSGRIGSLFGQPDCIMSLAKRFAFKSESERYSGDAFAKQAWWELNDFWMTTPAFVQATVLYLLNKSAQVTDESFISLVLREGPIPDVQLLARASYIMLDRSVRAVNAVEELQHTFPEAFDRCCSCKADQGRHDCNGTRQAIEGGPVPCWAGEHFVGPCLRGHTGAGPLADFVFSKLGIFSLSAQNGMFTTPEALDVLLGGPSQIAFVHNNAYTAPVYEALAVSAAVPGSVKDVLARNRELFYRGLRKEQRLDAYTSVDGATKAR